MNEHDFSVKSSNSSVDIIEEYFRRLLPERNGNCSRKIPKYKISEKPPEKGGLKSSKHGGHALQKRSFAVLTA